MGAPSFQPQPDSITAEFAKSLSQFQTITMAVSMFAKLAVAASAGATLAQAELVSKPKAGFLGKSASADVQTADAEQFVSNEALVSLVRAEIKRVLKSNDGKGPSDDEIFTDDHESNAADD